MEDMGENLVGAYMRQVRGCHTVAFNTFLPWGQGEIDVIGVRSGEPVEVWLGEVAVHLDSLNYGGYARTTNKIAAKVAAARRYAAEVYPAAKVTVELWSPVVPSGLLEPLAGTGAALVVNGEFTTRVGELLDQARASTRTTADPAFRLLQILTHLRNAGALTLGGGRGRRTGRGNKDEPGEDKQS